MMVKRLVRIQGMAQRYNKLDVVKDETLAAINTAVEARSIPKDRLISRDPVKDLQNPEH